MIRAACTEPDAVRSNRMITGLHYLLSEELAKAMGREGGPNFHSWAVWGSRKAGATIRQEDLDNAIHNASITAGVVGSVVGAARLVLEGNQIVLQDIGRQSARFLELLERGATSEARAVFFAGMRPGRTEQHGQERLSAAFLFLPCGVRFGRP